MPIPPRPRRSALGFWCALLIAVLAPAACMLPPNSRNDHPYRDLPAAHGAGGW
ncbi:MAG TPA: hypothetical protein VFA22_01105 [Stellaceae bacterium]|nr:hypothetical protein [Stellaceae bacterium]